MGELMFSITKKDFDISFFSGSGAGGQHRNKHQNCVRMRHPESGASSTGQDGKSRDQNIKKAFSRLVNSETFQKWLKMKIAQEAVDFVSIDERVQKAMLPENLRIEYGPF